MNVVLLLPLSYVFCFYVCETAGCITNCPSGIRKFSLTSDFDLLASSAIHLPSTKSIRRTFAEKIKGDIQTDRLLPFYLGFIQRKTCCLILVCHLIHSQTRRNLICRKHKVWLQTFVTLLSTKNGDSFLYVSKTVCILAKQVCLPKDH